MGNSVEEPLLLHIHCVDGGHQSAGTEFHSLAILHNREEKFEACLLLLCIIKWYLCIHAHVCMFCMQMHAETPPVFRLAEPKGVSLFLDFFPSIMAAFLCISNSYILVLSSWNETYSPK